MVSAGRKSDCLPDAGPRLPAGGPHAGGIRIRAYSVAEVAERHDVKPHLVLQWIQSGELRAIDVRAKTIGSKRPRWKILPEDLLAFEDRRASKPEQPQRARRGSPPAAAEPVGRRW